MILEHEGTEYAVSWGHVNNVGKVHNKSGQPMKSMTQCLIEVINPGDTQEDHPYITHIIGQYTFPKGVMYNRYEGRKKAFTAAVNKIASKEIRTILWVKFLNLRGPVIYEYNNKPYTIVRELKVKQADGSWANAILYKAMYNNPDGQYWVRLADDFIAKFRRVVDYTIVPVKR